MLANDTTAEPYLAFLRSLHRGLGGFAVCDRYHEFAGFTNGANRFGLLWHRLFLGKCGKGQNDERDQNKPFHSMLLEMMQFFSILHITGAILKHPSLRY